MPYYMAWVTPRTTVGWYPAERELTEGLRGHCLDTRLFLIIIDLMLFLFRHQLMPMWSTLSNFQTRRSCGISWDESPSHLKQDYYYRRTYRNSQHIFLFNFYTGWIYRLWSAFGQCLVVWASSLTCQLDALPLRERLDFDIIDNW